MRTVELSGNSLSRVLYALQIAVLLLALLFVAGPLDGTGNLPLAVLFGAFVVATAVGLWRTWSDGSGADDGAGDADGAGRPRPEAPGDITYDPIADPGQAARDRWEKAVRRLPGGDDEDQ